MIFLLLFSYFILCFCHAPVQLSWAELDFILKYPSSAWQLRTTGRPKENGAVGFSTIFALSSLDTIKRITYSKMYMIKSEQLAII
jgi:hypothetical protein